MEVNEISSCSSHFITGPSQLTLYSSETLRHRLKDRIRMPRSGKSQRLSHQCGTCWRPTIKMWVWVHRVPSFRWHFLMKIVLAGGGRKMKLHFQHFFNDINSNVGENLHAWKLNENSPYQCGMKTFLLKISSAINFLTFAHDALSNHVKLLCVHFDDERNFKADGDRRRKQKMLFDVEN